MWVKNVNKSLTMSLKTLHCRWRWREFRLWHHVGEEEIQKCCHANMVGRRWVVKWKTAVCLWGVKNRIRTESEQSWVFSLAAMTCFIIYVETPTFLFSLNRLIWNTELCFTFTVKTLTNNKTHTFRFTSFCVATSWSPSEWRICLYEVLLFHFVIKMMSVCVVSAQLHLLTCLKVDKKHCALPKHPPQILILHRYLLSVFLPYSACKQLLVLKLQKCKSWRWLFT